MALAARHPAGVLTIFATLDSHCSPFEGSRWLVPSELANTRHPKPQSHLFNSKGQASIADALFFLTIVMSLSALMFLFMSTYGESINKQLSYQYKADYVTSALATILNSSVERDDLPLTQSYEVDNFFAALKEDYFAYNGQISEKMKSLIYKRVRSVMYPVTSAVDYMFYVYVPPNFMSAYGGPGVPQPSDIVVLLLKKTDLVVCGGKTSSSTQADLCSKYYFCKPASFNDTMNKLLPKLGEIAKPTETRINLPVQAGDPVKAQVNMLMWTPINFPKEMEDNPNVFGELNCVPYALPTSP